MLPLLSLWLLALNVATFAAFGIDKLKAEGGVRRTRESTLLLLAMIGGTAGAFAGRAWFRHKTRKQPFSARLHLILVIQLGLALGLAAAELAA